MVYHSDPKAVDHGRFGGVEIAAPTFSRNPLLVFIGSCVAFSDRLLRLVEYELNEFQTMRLPDLDALSRLDDAARSSIRLLILDESATGHLSDLRDDLPRMSTGMRLVLAYRDVALARDLLATSIAEGANRELRYLPMHAPIDSWLSVLRLLSFGDAFIPAELISGDAQTNSRPSPEGPPEVASPTENHPPDDTGISPVELQENQSLTAREAQVLALVATGKRNKTIATDLGLSEHTVKLHVHNVFGKIGVRNRASAAHWYLSRSTSNGGAGRMSGLAK